jgi:hypothetical protein
MDKEMTKVYVVCYASFSGNVVVEMVTTDKDKAYAMCDDDCNFEVVESYLE